MNALPLPPLVRLIDDDAAFRESHQLLLELEGYEVAVYPGGAEFIAADDLSRPGCILLDIRMPGMSGLEIQQALIDRGSRLPIIILTGHGDVKTAVHTLKAGAFDFIEKSSNPEELLEAVRRACEKSSELAVHEAADARIIKTYESLTPREREVLRHSVRGLQVKEIAMRMGLSPMTVKMHRANAFAKIDAHTALEAFQWFEELPESIRRETHDRLTPHRLPLGRGPCALERPDRTRRIPLVGPDRHRLRPRRTLHRNCRGGSRTARSAP